jgi:hypothetical protein
MFSKDFLPLLIWCNLHYRATERLAFEQRQEKAAKAAAKAERQRQRQNALDNYKKKKTERFKMLSKKTRKGQPVMAGRMQLLLEKIQAQS